MVFNYFIAPQKQQHFDEILVNQQVNENLSFKIHQAFKHQNV